MARSEKQKSEALAALKANGGNVRKTAAEIGIPRETLNDWSRGTGINSDVAKSQPEKQESLADACERIAWQLLGSIPDKIAAAPLSQTSTSFGILIDKMRLLREQSTFITDNRVQIELLITELSARYGKPQDEIRRDLVKIRPETAAYVERAA